jgi:hypothetical protein
MARPSNITYLLFHMVGYNGEDPLHNLEEKVVIRLIDTNVDSALDRAKRLVEKKWWIVAEIVEFKDKED